MAAVYDHLLQMANYFFDRLGPSDERNHDLARLINLQLKPPMCQVLDHLSTELQRM